MSEKQTAYVKKRIEELRNKLLDLGLRNKLIQFRHNARHKIYARLVDASLDQIFDRLCKDEKECTFRGLSIEAKYEDEESEEFQKALKAAKRKDNEYLKERAEWEAEENPSQVQETRIDRRLRDRVRASLGMKHITKVKVDPIAFAEEQGIDPSYDLTKPTSTNRSERQLQTLYTDTELKQRLKKIEDQYGSSIQERGINTLYLAMGFLEWTAHESSDSVITSPLILLRLELEKKKSMGRNQDGKKEICIRAESNETIHNASLAAKLKKDFRYDLPERKEEEGPEAYLKRVEKSLHKSKDWKVRRFATVCHLSFQKITLYEDLGPNRWKGKPLHSQKLLNNIISGNRSSNNSGLSYSEDYPIDELPDKEIVDLLVRDADSSQHSALVDALDGKNLVVEGPPGTGKSQTITNLIAACMHRGKSVLFVAEKLAALQVVKNRLDDCKCQTRDGKKASLGDFCLELHSNKVRRTAVHGAMKRRLELRGMVAEPRDYEFRREQIWAQRERMKDFLDWLHTPVGSTELTFFQIIWGESSTADNLDQLTESLDPIYLENCDSLKPQERVRLKEAAAEYATAYLSMKASCEGMDVHPWLWVKNVELGRYDAEELYGKVIETHEKLADCKGFLDKLSASFNWPEFSNISDPIKLRERLLSLSIPDIDLSLLKSLSAPGCASVIESEMEQILSYRELLEKLHSKIKGPRSLVSWRELPGLIDEIKCEAYLPTKTQGEVQAEINANRCKIAIVESIEQGLEDLNYLIEGEIQMLTLSDINLLSKVCAELIDFEGDLKALLASGFADLGARNHWALFFEEWKFAKSKTEENSEKIASLDGLDSRELRSNAAVLREAAFLQKLFNFESIEQGLEDFNYLTESKIDVMTLSEIKLLTEVCAELIDFEGDLTALLACGFADLSARKRWALFFEEWKLAKSKTEENSEKIASLDGLDSRELRSNAAVLREAGFFQKLFSKDVKDAKSLFFSIYVGSEKLKIGEQAKLLLEAAKTRELVEAVERNKHVGLLPNHLTCSTNSDLESLNDQLIKLWDIRHRLSQCVPLRGLWDQLAAADCDKQINLCAQFSGQSVKNVMNAAAATWQNEQGIAKTPLKVTIQKPKDVENAKNLFFSIYVGSEKLTIEEQAELLLEAAKTRALVEAVERSKHVTLLPEHLTCSTNSDLNSLNDQLFKLWGIRNCLSKCRPLKGLLEEFAAADNDRQIVLCNQFSGKLVKDAISAANFTWKNDQNIAISSLKLTAQKPLEDAERLISYAERIGLLDGQRFSDLRRIISELEKLLIIKDEIREGQIAEIIGSGFSILESKLGIISSLLEYIKSVDSIQFEGDHRIQLLSENGRNWLEKVLRECQPLDDISKDFNARLRHLHHKAHGLPCAISPDNVDKADLNELEKAFASAIDAKALLFGHLSFIYCSQTIEQLSANEIIECVRDKTSDVAVFEAAVDYVFYRSILKDNQRKQKLKLSRNAIEGYQRQFCELDKQLQDLTIQNVISGQEGINVPRGVGEGPRASWTGLSLVELEANKQKRHLPLRRYLSSAGEAVRSLMPCMMMSPQTVAEFIEPKRDLFDIVIIDEASQMRPEEAVSALARGKQLVVVGDDKQLPPSSFFMANEEIAEDEEEEDNAESILEMAAITFEDIRRLRWHYRSRHDSLIQYSNGEFYDNQLVVFPSPVDTNYGLGITYHYSTGHYHEGLNESEADKVVLLVVHLMTAYPNKSIGIATMNSKQRELLFDEISKVSESNSRVARYISKWEEQLEYFFVKNLENVQGDERDIIVISTVYGPTEEDQKVSQNFGPINKQYGHRRLNVLFTRAKEAIHLVTSLKPSDIKTGEGTKRGVKVFREYLQYAIDGFISTSSESHRNIPDNDFERSVGRVLNQHGYNITYQVGSSGYYIDIGVMHPNGSEGFIMAVECDGAPFHSSKSARDRDRLRQEQLERLGWRFHRIWSTDWYRARAREEKKLIEAVKNAESQYDRKQESLRIEPLPT